MNYTAHIKILPLKDLLDPQGKAVMGGLKNLEIQSVHDVRVGKYILLQIEASSQENAMKIASDAAEQLLANPVMETFEVSVQQEQN